MYRVFFVFALWLGSLWLTGCPNFTTSQHSDAGPSLGISVSCAAGVEICNGIDDDCDGLVDEGCPCQPHQSRDCYTAPTPTLAVGSCLPGRQSCINGQWSTQCEGVIVPQPEQCNGKDDDCDGFIDEDIPDKPCQTSCQTGIQSCKNGEWSPCSQLKPITPQEICNGVDDNCDGVIDEGCDCTDGSTRPCGLNQGICKPGKQSCVNGKWAALCEGAISPHPETCNQKDDDCDGLIDNIEPRVCRSACGQGLESCRQGIWQGCTAPLPQTEICNNLDDDCNGVIDDNLTRPCQSACGTGQQICDKGSWQPCNARSPTPELCNNLDDDCNGKIDDGLGEITCGMGGCSQTVPSCQQGKPATCQPLPPSAQEFCGNGIDDNCDGKTDENCQSCLPTGISHLLSPALQPEAQQEPITDLAFSPDGTLLASASIDKTVKLWKWPSLQLIRTSTAHTQAVTAVAFSPDGTLLASASIDKTVIISDTATGKILYTQRTHTDGIKAMQFSPDGTLLATGSLDQTLRVWLFRGGRFPLNFPAQTAPVVSVAFSPNGQWLASASGLTISVWSLPQGTLRHTLTGHKDAVVYLTFSPDSKLLATASNDDTIILWDTTTAQKYRTLVGHKAVVNRVAFAKDGQSLASVSNDKTSRYWDLHTGKTLAILTGHTDWIQAVTYSPDGQFLATGADDKTIRFWQCPTTRCTQPGQTLCQGVCVDVQNNLLHCGACHQMCSSQGQRCIQGTCQCPAGQTVCQGICTDLSSQWEQCGRCGYRCPSGQQKCVQGQCTTGCPSHLTLCNGQCVDLQTSRSDCGACGVSCQGLCCAGTCYPADSTIHCAQCDNRCPTGAVCQLFCRCPSGQYACDGKCVDLLVDPEHCGLCGNRCPATPQHPSGSCQQGICQ